ncbi:MAG: helix-turn-helix transcriptional regulator [Bacillota bacterium]|nr:helix-turn-helix transcriptional regulator [Bacillota bacterium]
MSELLPKRLLLLRNRRHMSQKNLAEMLGLPRGTYTHYELGRRTPDVDMLMKIADSHHVSMDYLTGYTDRMPTYAEWSADHPDQSVAVSPDPFYPLTGQDHAQAQVADAGEKEDDGQP